MKKIAVGISVVALLCAGALLWVTLRPRPDGPFSQNLQVIPLQPAPIGGTTILFVHGLGGDYEDTWRPPGKKGATKTWMQLLQEDAGYDKLGIAAVKYDTGIFGHGRECNADRVTTGGRTGQALADEPSRDHYRMGANFPRMPSCLRRSVGRTVTLTR